MLGSNDLLDLARIARGMSDEELIRSRDDLAEKLELLKATRVPGVSYHDEDETNTTVQDGLRVLRRELSRRGYKSAGKQRTTQASTAQPAEKEKRGRPQRIPDAQKAQALEIKEHGGTNKDAARKLYNVRFPTPQQVKNVPTILRHFKRKPKLE